MNTSLLCFVLVSLLLFSCGKVIKKSNVIAVFSEDDLSGKLPKPEIIAAEIPEKLILKKSSKLKVAANQEITGGDPDMTKIKKKVRRYVNESFDRKSKSMTEREEEGYEPYIVVDGTAIASQVISSTNLPTATASIVTVTATANVDGDIIKIAKLDATTLPQSDEVISIPPQKIRQFIPRSRMNVKRASSSANPCVLFDFKLILVISFMTLFIMNI
jgi:hypothetical protein